MAQLSFPKHLGRKTRGIDDLTYTNHSHPRNHSSARELSHAYVCSFHYPLCVYTRADDAANPRYLPVRFDDGINSRNDDTGPQ